MKKIRLALLEEIREIRASERMAYQKITDIYATSIDYSPKAEDTKLFFAVAQPSLGCKNRYQSTVAYLGVAITEIPGLGKAHDQCRRIPVCVPRSGWRCTEQFDRLTVSTVEVDRDEVE